MGNTKGSHVLAHHCVAIEEILKHKDVNKYKDTENKHNKQ